MRRAGATLGGTLCACALVCGSADAQVLEIADGGAVTVFDRPSIFTDDGAAPIERQRAHAVRPARVSLDAAEAVTDAAQGASLSRDLVEAVAWQESRLRSGLVSPAGAIGEMQLMPSTAHALGVDPWNTRDNVRGGANYLSGLLRRYDGDLIRALAAYNAGPGAVDRYGGVPPYRETRAYVTAIMNRLGSRAVQGVTPSER